MASKNTIFVPILKFLEVISKELYFSSKVALLSQNGEVCLQIQEAEAVKLFKHLLP